MAGESRQHSHFERDLETLPRPIPGWDAEWIHFGPGPVSGDASQVKFGTGTFAVFQTASAGVLRGTTGPDSRAFLASLPAADHPRAYAQAITAETGLSLSPGNAFDLYLPEGGGIMIFALPASSPAATHEGHGGFPVQRRTLNPAQTALLSRCRESLDGLRTAAATSRPVSGAHRSLLQSAAAALSAEHGKPSNGQRDPLQRHVAVVRACAYIETHLRSSIGLADLCSAAGVCTRALEYGFHDFYDLGPMAYVRNLRLCRVRHELQYPGRDGDSVSSAARRWSFTHMGQFSHDYRVLFGEMPSATLARGRGTAPPAVPRERKSVRGFEPRS